MGDAADDAREMVLQSQIEYENDLGYVATRTLAENIAELKLYRDNKRCSMLPAIAKNIINQYDILGRLTPRQKGVINRTLAQWRTEEDCPG
jgi:hypothetical protein